MTEPRRIRPPHRNHAATDIKVLDILIENKIFETKQKALMFAAALGAHLQKREVVKGYDEPIRWEIFQTDGDDSFIYALAIAEANSLSILSDSAELGAFVNIFEEYANAGLTYIEQEIISKPVDMLDSLIGLLLTVRRREEKILTGLSSITPEQLSALGL